MLGNGNDDDIAQELEGLDITKCKEKIKELHSEIERQKESVERLQEKIKALNPEVAAARRQEADRLKRSQAEADRARRAAKDIAVGGSSSSNTSFIARFIGASSASSSSALTSTAEEQAEVRRSIEEQLTAQVPNLPELNEYSIRKFTEKELMVETPQGDGADGTALMLNTVLIRREVQELKYFLSFRVGRHTTAGQIREEACVYWGISEVEYILLLRDDSTVPDDLPIHSCFNDDERAEFRLVQKVAMKTTLPENIIELIRARVGPKSTKQKTRKQTTSAETQQSTTAENPQNLTLAQQMSKHPGVFEFMTQRDLRDVTHMKRIKPRAICLYLCLLITSMCSFVVVRRPGEPFYCRYGVYEALAHTSAQDFDKIRIESDVWKWLTQGIPWQLFNASSDLRQANYLPGWMRVRMQQVRDVNGTCPMNSKLPAYMMCQDSVYSDETAGTEDLVAVRDLWAGRRGVAGRSNVTEPWRYMNHSLGQATGSHVQTGIYQEFDASGYAVDYDLQPDDLTATYAAFVQDMQDLKDAQWVSRRTRAVHVSFTVYNANYDYWVTSFYLLEMHAAGLVSPTSDVDVMRPATDELSNNMAIPHLCLDIVRMVFVFFVLFDHIRFEVIYESDKHDKNTSEQRTFFQLPKLRQSWRYLLGPQGLSDFSIVALGIAIFVVRWLDGRSIQFSAVTRAQAHTLGFRDESAPVFYYRQNIVLEAFLLMLIFFRLCILMRVNRHVFIIYETFARSLSRYARFLLVFLPVTIGFVLIGHVFFRAHHFEYSTWWSSATSTLMIMLGDVTALSQGRLTRPWTVIYMVALYVCLILFLLNSWIGILVQEYQKCRVAYGYRPEEYAWDRAKYIEWFQPVWMKKCLDSLPWKKRDEHEGAD